jgi:hypothetical protein
MPVTITKDGVVFPDSTWQITGFNIQTLGTDIGYQKLPGGVIIQWGQTTSYQRKTVPFLYAFPNACCAVQATRRHYKVWSYGNEVYTHTFTPSSFQFEISAKDGAFVDGAWVSWVAIGY